MHLLRKTITDVSGCAFVRYTFPSLKIVPVRFELERGASGNDSFQKGRRMPKPFKLLSARPLPLNAEIFEHEGKPHVRLKDRGRVVLYPLTKDETKFLVPSKRYYFKCPDGNGTIRRVKGFSDLKATEQLAAETERKASRVRSGYTDPAEEHARRPLAEHLKDYTAHLQAKGNVPVHVSNVVAKITALLKGCGYVFPMDVDTGKAAEWLIALRRNGVPIALPEGDVFTPGAVAQLFGISGTAIRGTVKRMNLSATGKGKARRYPRATVESLALNRAKGCGPETVNHYVRAVRGFFRWLVKVKRIGSNPLDSLPLLNAAVDVRRARRELTADELRRLFTAARSSKRTFRGLAGADRFALYLTAAGTGFRASALANLTPADFDFDAGTVTLAARFAKNRRMKVQPLPADVAAELRDYLEGKPANSPVWGGTWASARLGAEMLRGDLEAAGIPYAVERQDGPEYADFHSLRHSFLTLGGRSGIDLRTLQELAGHSTPSMTARYSHRRLYDLQGAVDKLPNLVPTDPSTATAVEIPRLCTGTDGATTSPTAVPQAVPAGYSKPHQSASSCNFRIADVERTDSEKHLELLEKTPICTNSHQSSSERAMGFEPTTASLEGSE